MGFCSAMKAIRAGLVACILALLSVSVVQGSECEVCERLAGRAAGSPGPLDCDGLCEGVSGLNLRSCTRICGFIVKDQEKMSILRDGIELDYRPTKRAAENVLPTEPGFATTFCRCNANCAWPADGPTPQCHKTKVVVDKLDGECEACKTMFGAWHDRDPQADGSPDVLFTQTQLDADCTNKITCPLLKLSLLEVWRRPVVRTAMHKLLTASTIPVKGEEMAHDWTAELFCNCLRRTSHDLATNKVIEYGLCNPHQQCSEAKAVSLGKKKDPPRPHVEQEVEQVKEEEDDSPCVEQVCVGAFESFDSELCECRCQAGYQRNDDGVCEEENLCVEQICSGPFEEFVGKAGQEIMVENEENPCECRCLAGYQRNDDGRCEEENLCVEQPCSKPHELFVGTPDLEIDRETGANPCECRCEQGYSRAENGLCEEEPRPKVEEVEEPVLEKPEQLCVKQACGGANERFVGTANQPISFFEPFNPCECRCVPDHRRNDANECVKSCPKQSVYSNPKCGEFWTEDCKCVCPKGSVFSGKSQEECTRKWTDGCDCACPASSVLIEEEVEAGATSFVCRDGNDALNLFCPKWTSGFTDCMQVCHAYQFVANVYRSRCPAPGERFDASKMIGGRPYEDIECLCSNNNTCSSQGLYYQMCEIVYPRGSYSKIIYDLLNEMVKSPALREQFKQQVGKSYSQVIRDIKADDLTPKREQECQSTCRGLYAQKPVADGQQRKKSSYFVVPDNVPTNGPVADKAIYVHCADMCKPYCSRKQITARLPGCV